MMRKVQIDEPGDTRFLEQQVVDKLEFMEENDRIWGKKVVVDAGSVTRGRPPVISPALPTARGIFTITSPAFTF